MSRIAASILAAALALAASFPALATESVKTVAITASEFKFTPARVTLTRGQRVALEITDRGTMDHEFLSTIFKAAKDVAIKAEGIKVEAGEVEEVQVEKGHMVTIELTPTRTGTYQFWCAEVLKGKLHRDLGMRGILTVRP